MANLQGAPDLTPSPYRPPRWQKKLAAAIGWSVGLLFFTWLGIGCWTRTYPALDMPLRLKVVFPRGVAGANEPLVATGHFGDADFFDVKYRDPDTAVLNYDAWGFGGPDSKPFDLRPGSVHVLEIQMPSFTAIGRPQPAEKRPIHVSLDGKVMLSGDVIFHGRDLNEIYFGINPLGGTPGPAFRGELRTEDNRPLRGGPIGLYTKSERLAWLLRHQIIELLIVLIAPMLIGFGATRFIESEIVAVWLCPAAPNTPRRSDVPHLIFLVVAGLCTLGFVTLLTGGTFRLKYADSFGQFYDYQAQSLLHGRLDVPEPAISGEAFVVNGKTYGYFGITPAVLRIPLVAAHLAFAQLTRAYMFAYFIGCLAATYGLVIQAYRAVFGSGCWPSRWAVALLVGGSGLGSTLFFLGSRAYTYHEAILCGAMFALWSTYCGFRYLEAPNKLWWAGALVCGALAVHARPPPGLFALCFLGCVSAYLCVKGGKTNIRSRIFRHAGVGVLAILGVLSFNGLSYLKFHTFDGAPLRYNVQYSAERLARFGGTNFHIENLRHNFDAYVASPDFHFEAHFPYVFFGARHHRAYPEAKIDMEDSTLAFPYSMSGLFFLAIVGGGWALLRAPRLRRLVLLLGVACVPMALAMFMAIATSHRYTGDFCPFLIALAAVGVIAWDAERTTMRRIFLGCATALAIWSLVVSLSLSIEFQGKGVWGSPPETVRNFERLRDAFDHFFGSKHP